MDLPSQALSALTAFMGIATVKGTLLVAAVLLIQSMAGRHLSANVRYMLWFPVLIALIVPVGIDVHFPAGSIPVTRAAVAAPAETSIAADAAGLQTASTPQVGTGARDSFRSDPSSASARPDSNAVNAARPVPWLDFLACVWLLGVLVVLGAVAWSCHRFSRIVSGATATQVELQLLLKDCMVQTSCRIPVSVLHSSDVHVPMVAGLLKPVLLLPAGMELQLSRAQLRHVFIHELMHLQRGDLVSNWIVALAQALHWFNPAVWFAFYCMRQDRELACDAATLRHLVPAERATYGHTLLQLNDMSARVVVPTVALGMLESASHLQRRICMLVRIPPSQKLQSLIAAVSLLSLAAVAISQPVSVLPAAPIVVAEASAPAAAPLSLPATPVVAPPTATAESARRPVIPVTGEEAAVPRPASPVAEDVSVNQAQPTTGAVQQTGAAAAAPLLAQVDVAPVSDAFAVPAAESTNVIAAATTAPAHAASEPATDIPDAVLRMTDEINALKNGQMGVIEEWNGKAVACEARKDQALFGTLSKACQEVRVIQIRGDVFRFVYACHVLGLQQAAQWVAWREALAQQQPDMTGVETTLRANERELAALCDKATYANDYPGFSKMLADAAALKYYNPWRTVRYATPVSPWGPPYVNSAYTSAYSQSPPMR